MGFTVAAVFSDNMVLQKGKNVAVWGEAQDSAVVAAEINGASAETVAKDGKWMLNLPPMEYGGPYELTVKSGSEEKKFKNVMVGEVWLCGGQSNMELELQNCKGGKDVLKDLTPDCNVRFYYTNKYPIIDDKMLEAERNSGWKEAGSESARNWSAVGFFFGRKLAKELGVTVGLIGCNWGGTSASAWMDRPSIENCKETESYIAEYLKGIEGKSVEQQIAEYDAYQEDFRRWNEEAQEKVYKNDPTADWDTVVRIIGKNPWPGPINCKNEYRPCGLYETMLMRICPYTLKGFLYYQGESDDHKPDSYYKLFSNLIALWRERWGDDELPFIITQLPMFRYEHDEDKKHWCKIREAQMRAYKTIKNTGIAVTTDCGELNNIHPLDKVPVGERLCLQAEKLFYGMDVEAFGPIFRDAVAKDGGLELSFHHAEGGFEVKTESIEGFEVAGADGVYKPALAEIRGERIFVSSSEVEKPYYVRYDWSNYIIPSIYGRSGIPMAPFRSDKG